MEIRPRFNVGDSVWIWCYGYDMFVKEKISYIEIFVEKGNIEIFYNFDGCTRDSARSEEEVFKTKKEALEKFDR